MCLMNYGYKMYGYHAILRLDLQLEYNELFHILEYKYI